MTLPRYQVFFCLNKRKPGDVQGCCYARGASELASALERELAARGLAERVVVGFTGCLDRCAEGPVAVVLPVRGAPLGSFGKLQRFLGPRGVYYGRLFPADLPGLVERHLQGDEPLRRCVIP